MGIPALFCFFLFTSSRAPMWTKIILLAALLSSIVSGVCSLPATQKSIRYFARNKQQHLFYSTPSSLVPSPNNNKNDNNMLNKLAAAAVVLGAAFFWNNFFPGTDQQQLYETVEGWFTVALLMWRSSLSCLILYFRLIRVMCFRHPFILLQRA